ncbi:MAG: alpha/beta fold hydrolase [Deltaproteobacteria bacterium]|jgi:polyhydroxyalkanoate synthase|nr:alpha/beta fold hydrolase [Deltaproteobacteria bacterium]MBW2531394.1 alpha/beta fold hydrolase [Deltaproteobacteria bacterium]
MPLIYRRTSARQRSWLRRAADRGVISAVNGMVYLLEGAARPSMGNVARQQVFRDGKLALYRVRPIGEERYELGHDEYTVPLVERHRTPVLVIPPLMVRPYVYDLRPEHSMLRTLRNAGFDVFFVDFGVPDETDEQVRLDDYVLQFVPRCVNETLAAAQSSRLSMVGYCMGGIFALLHVGTHRDGRVANVVTIGAPVDFSRMGIISAAARLGVITVDVLMDRIGNVPGALSSVGFKVMSGGRLVTKWVDLLVNLSDERYVRGFDAINTWVNDLIPYPRDAFKQLVKEVVSGNKLIAGELSFGDERCDLDEVRCALLSFAGESDNIATASATRRVVDVVGSKDKTFMTVPGGHVGVVAGTHAPDRVWQPMCEWLAARSDAGG